MYYLKHFDNILGDWGGSKSPGLEILKGENSYQVRAELPGVEEADLNVRVEDGHLVIAGERKVEENQDYKVSYTELSSYQRFERRLKLAREIDTEKVAAALKNGVLTVELPLSEARKPKKIAVNAA